MTTVLQTCVETPLIFETTTVKLKVASQKTLEYSSFAAAASSGSCSSASKSYGENSESSRSSGSLGGWSFLQALSDVTSNPRMAKQEYVYVPPLSKQYYSSSSMLSLRSLELCTESLGNETGCDSIMDCSILSLSSRSSSYAGTLEREYSSPSAPSSSPKEEEEEENRPEYYYQSSRKIKSKATHSYQSYKNFPPPLTTRSGSKSLHVRAHREEGRLVLETVEAPFQKTCFHAERSDGRLRLTLLEDHLDSKVDSKVVSSIIEENDTGDDVESRDRRKQSVQQEKVDTMSMNGVDHHSRIKIHRAKNNDDDDDQGYGAYSGRVMAGNGTEMEVETGREKYQRWIGRRCKEGGHGTKRLSNWEPLWVATS